MNLTDQELLEINGLCQAVADGVATESQRAQLNRWLAESEEARQFYVRMMTLCASLFDYASEMQSEAPESPIPFTPPAKSHAWVWALAALATAAVIVLAFRFGLQSGDASRADSIAAAEQDADEPIARLSAATDCKWQGAQSQLGDELKRGQRVELLAGFAEITFDSGAQVMLEGPAILELRSAWEALLQRGSLKANVPPEAVGFRVSNPSVDVVDLGTEFSMVAEPGGATEVFVLKGSVEAAGRDASGQSNPPVILHTRQARRFARGTAGEVGDRDRKLEKFLRKIVMKRAAVPAGYVHWSFDDSNGDRAAANTIGISTGDFDARILGTQTTTRAAGKWGQALVLDGGQYARAPFPGISRRAARTVAFWVNIPANASPSEADAILSWRQAGAGGAYPVEIGWNPNPGEGAFGAVRTNLGASSIVGVTPLRDGRWHHLAIVFTPKRKSDSAMQIRQYVDGRLESASDHHAGKRDRRILSAKGATGGTPDEALWIGSNTESHGPEEHHMVGSLDELFVADRALSPQEIRHLIKKNSPAPSETVAVD